MDSPFLSTWKTNIGATIGGILLALFLNRVLIPAIPEDLWMISIMISVAFLGFAIYYALGVYPSLFSSYPKLQSNGAISFFNGMFGGIIFTCLWNSNLTNQRKGISNIVYVVLMVILLIVECSLLLYAYS
jgi:hypothetical protein